MENVKFTFTWLTQKSTQIITLWMNSLFVFIVTQLFVFIIDTTDPTVYCGEFNGHFVVLIFGLKQ